MRKFIFFIGLSLLTIFVFSCQKEVSEEIPIQETEKDSIYISQLIIIDSIQSAGMDTASKMRFTYDAQKRITFCYGEESMTGTGFPDLTWIEKYHYNGTDSVPYLLTVVSSDPNGVVQLRDSSFYTYSADGKVFTDSLREFTPPAFVSIYKTRFEKRSANQYRELFTMGFDSILLDLDFANQNISREQREFFNNGSSQFTDITNRTYVDKINPLFRISIPYPCISGEAYPGRIGIHQKNNILTESVSGSGESFTTSYNYRDDGYPLTSRKTDPLNPQFLRKTLFIYTSL